MQDFQTKTWPICEICLRITKMSFLFYVRQLEMQKMHFKNVTSSPLPGLWPLHRQKQRYCFEILQACCLYVSRLHIFRFMKISPDLENISRNQTFCLKHLKILRFFNLGNFEITVFFLRLFYAYDPILKSLGC